MHTYNRSINALNPDVGSLGGTGAAPNYLDNSHGLES